MPFKLHSRTAWLGSLVVASTLALASQAMSDTSTPTQPGIGNAPIILAQSAAPLGKVTGPKPTAAKPHAVGSCNDRYGCNRLKVACESSGKGYDYKPSNSEGTKGVCMKSMVGGTKGLTAVVSPVGAAFCNDKVLCGKLKSVCHGGVYKPGTGGSGTCTKPPGK